MNFTPEQETEVIEWYEENRHLYDKSDKQYKHSEMRERKLSEKARELNITTNALKTWWKGLRTRFTKALQKEKGKSGQAPAHLTPREIWILMKLRFLTAYVRRNRPTSSLKPKLQLRLTPTAETAEAPPTE